MNLWKPSGGHWTKAGHAPEAGTATSPTLTVSHNGRMYGMLRRCSYKASCGGRCCPDFSPVKFVSPTVVLPGRTQCRSSYPVRSGRAGESVSGKCRGIRCARPGY